MLQQADPVVAGHGHELIAVQYGLDSFEEDVATVKRTLNRVGSPVILVGHSYGGAAITARASISACRASYRSGRAGCRRDRTEPAR